MYTVYSVRLSFLCVAPPEHVALQFCHFCGSLRTWKSSSFRVKRKHKGQKSCTSKHIVSALDTKCSFDYLANFYSQIYVMAYYFEYSVVNFKIKCNVRMFKTQCKVNNLKTSHS